MMEQENQTNNDAQGVSFTESIMHLLVMPGYNDPRRLLLMSLFDFLNIYIAIFCLQHLQSPFLPFKARISHQYCLFDLRIDWQQHSIIRLARWVRGGVRRRGRGCQRGPASTGDYRTVRSHAAFAASIPGCRAHAWLVTDSRYRRLQQWHVAATQWGSNAGRRAQQWYPREQCFEQ